MGFGNDLLCFPTLWPWHTFCIQRLMDIFLSLNRRTWMDTLNLTKLDLKFLLALASLVPIISFIAGVSIANSANASAVAPTNNYEPQYINASNNSLIVSETDDIERTPITKHYIVQAGLFSNKENANKLSISLAKKKLDTQIISENKNGVPIFRVIIGSFESEDRAKTYSDDIEQIHAIKLYVTATDSSKA